VSEESRREIALITEGDSALTLSNKARSSLIERGRSDAAMLTALAALRKAAEQGYADCQYNLGVMYQNGFGVGIAQDYYEAAFWYRKAAEQGDAVAQHNLGVMCYCGQGLPRDYSEAATWFRKAADQGLKDAQVNLGRMYANGQGVPQDYAESAKWFRKAADQGDADSQFSLGEAYHNGRGVKQDYVLAHMWENLSVSNSTGEEQSMRAKARDEVARQLSPQQLAEAHRMAREWRPA
jgi:uncharacterized protein